MTRTYRHRQDGNVIVVQFDDRGHMIAADLEGSPDAEPQWLDLTLTANRATLQVLSRMIGDGTYVLEDGRSARAMLPDDVEDDALS